jgi:adenylate kinase family enzyme
MHRGQVMQNKVAKIPRPLLGNENGIYKIAIVGNSGSGKVLSHQRLAHIIELCFPKTTLASQLSEILCIPYLSLDEVYWNPGWIPTDPEILQSRVKTFLDSYSGGWIVDGNYVRMIGPVILNTATDVLCKYYHQTIGEGINNILIGLDPPLIVNFWRILRRTFGRLFLGESPCAAGCDEHIGETLGSRKSILLWCLTQHSVCRAEFTVIWNRESAEEGRGKWRRFGGWGSDLKRWLDWLKDSV